MTKVRKFISSFLQSVFQSLQNIGENIKKNLQYLAQVASKKIQSHQSPRQNSGT